MGKNPLIFHIGDHDPSGIDITRDMHERVSLFTEQYFPIYRIALNYDQIEEYKPPPNPTKFKDPRSKDYIAKYGTDSWELDALNPDVLVDLVQELINDARDDDIWEKTIERQEHERTQIDDFVSTWEDEDEE